MDGATIDHLIQGGGTSVALVALWIIYKVITNHQVHTNDIIERNAVANTKLAHAIEALDKTVQTKL
jgi:hypothetical protein